MKFRHLIQDMDISSFVQMLRCYWKLKEGNLWMNSFNVRDYYHSDVPIDVRSHDTDHVFFHPY